MPLHESGWSRLSGWSQEQGEAEDDTALVDQEGESESRQRGASREGRRPAVADAEEDDVL